MLFSQYFDHKLAKIDTFDAPMDVNPGDFVIPLDQLQELTQYFPKQQASVQDYHMEELTDPDLLPKIPALLTDLNLQEHEKLRIVNQFKSLGLDLEPVLQLIFDVKKHFLQRRTQFHSADWPEIGFASSKICKCIVTKIMQDDLLWTKTDFKTQSAW